MSDLLIRLLIATASKLLTEAFLAKFLIHSLRAWAKSTDTDWDNKIVEAMAEALGVPTDKLQELAK